MLTQQQIQHPSNISRGSALEFKASRDDLVEGLKRKNVKCSFGTNGKGDYVIFKLVLGESSKSSRKESNDKRNKRSYLA